MKSKRLHWLAPLLAVWVTVWQACFGALAMSPVDSPRAACCSAGFHASRPAGCHASCCATPVGKDAERAPAAPAPSTTSVVPDWVPALLVDFLSPRVTAANASFVASADPSLHSVSAPLFRRYCALLI